MTITLVTDRWDEDGGGCERYLLNLATHLVAVGHTVRVHCRRARRGTKPTEGVPVRTFAGRAPYAESRLARAVAEDRQRHSDGPLLSARPFETATHYQLHSGLYRDSFAAEREAMDSPLRRLLYWPALRLNAQRTWLLRAEERMLAGPRRPRFMVFSKAMRDTLISRGVPAEAIEVLPHGVDLAIFKPPELAPRHHVGPVPQASRPSLRLLFVGHDFVRKGLVWLLLGVARARRLGVDAHLDVAGADRPGPFHRLAKAEGIADHVRFLGNVDRLSLARLYREADALVHPTFYDPFSLVVLEALASGCPVVTTPRCGAAELITPGREGFLIDDPRDTHRLSEVLERLAEPKSRERLRADAALLGGRFAFGDHVRAVTRWLGLPVDQSSAGADEGTTLE